MSASACWRPCSRRCHDEAFQKPLLQDLLQKPPLLLRMLPVLDATIPPTVSELQPAGVLLLPCEVVLDLLLALPVVVVHIAAYPTICLRFLHFLALESLPDACRTHVVGDVRSSPE